MVNISFKWGMCEEASLARRRNYLGRAMIEASAQSLQPMELKKAG